MNIIAVYEGCIQMVDPKCLRFFEVIYTINTYIKWNVNGDEQLTR